MLHQPLERKLSSLLGAEVTIEKFKFSILAGSVEAVGVTVAGDAGGPPVLTIRRVRAEVSVAKALAKQIVVKALTIEGPVLSIVRRGGAINLPRRQAVSTGEPAERAAPPGEANDSGWKLEAQNVALSDGSVTFREESAEHPYEMSADGIAGELRHHEGDVDVTVSSESVGRRDRPIDLGPLRLTGRFVGVADLARIASAPFSLSLTLPGRLKADVTSPSLNSRDFAVQLEGPVDLRELAELVPVDSLPAPLRSPGLSGKVQVSARLQLSRDGGLRIDELNVRATDVVIPPRLPS